MLFYINPTSRRVMCGAHSIGGTGFNDASTTTKTADFLLLPREQSYFVLVAPLGARA